VTTCQVGRLITDIGNDRVPIFFDPLTLRCLEVRGGCITGAIRLQVKSPIARKTHCTKIFYRCGALPLIPAGNEENRNAQRTRLLENRKHLGDCRRPCSQVPRDPSTWTIGQRPAWALEHAAEVICHDDLPIRQHRVIDVEHQRRSADLRRALRQSGADPRSNGREVALISSRFVVGDRGKFCVADVGRFAQRDGLGRRQAQTLDDNQDRNRGTGEEKPAQILQNPAASPSASLPRPGYLDFCNSIHWSDTSSEYFC
jgi:hypothetical protein